MLELWFRDYSSAATWQSASKTSAGPNHLLDRRLPAVLRVPRLSAGFAGSAAGDSSRSKKQPITPFVSLLIPAYNEADVIERKIDNSLALDYPADRIEIVVASDGSQR